MLQSLATSEASTLHHILQAIIIDGFQRMRPEVDIKSNAEAAAKAFRAGLAAFTAPPEALVGGSVNASIPSTVKYGSTEEAAVQHSATGGRFPASTATHIERAAQQNVESMTRLAALKRMADAAACDQDHGLAAWALLLSQAGAGLDDSAKSLGRISELQRLADAAGTIAFALINESKAQSHHQQGCSGTA